MDLSSCDTVGTAGRKLVRVRLLGVDVEQGVAVGVELSHYYDIPVLI